MKLVAIGDIHGRDIWKQIVAQEQDADEFVFVGDYFDSFTVKGPDQINNFLDIIEFKKQSKVDRYEVALELFKEKNKKAADEFELILLTQTK